MLDSDDHNIILLDLSNGLIASQICLCFFAPQSLSSIPPLSPRKPVHDDNEHNDSIYSRDVIHICADCQPSHILKQNFLRQGLDDLLPPETGFAGGNEYIIIVKQVHNSNTMLANSPKEPNQKGP